MGKSYRGLWALVAAGVSVGGCDEPVAPGTGGTSATVVESLRSVEEGGDPEARFCSSAATCADVDSGATLGAGRFSTEDDTTATLRVGELEVLVGPDAALVLPESGGKLAIERGDVTLECDPGSEGVGFVVAGRDARIRADRRTRVTIAAGEAGATVTVRKGRLEIDDEAGTITLLKGQSAELGGKELQARLAYTPLSATRSPLAAPAPSSERIVHSSSEQARGLGRMTARRPGREDVIAGVELAQHAVSVVVRDGVATTTVEEEFQNTTSEVLEGRFVFPVPADASVSDLTLWVGDDPVPAELVERKRAARIFKGIVDDTVRPRDPALLEWAQGRELSLKIFPIFPKSSRRVRFTFEQPVRDLNGSGRYVYPLSPGLDRATKVGRFSISVRLEERGLSDVATPRYGTTLDTGWDATSIAYEATGFVPSADFVVAYKRPHAADAIAVVEPARACDAAESCAPAMPGATLVRTLVRSPAGQALPPPVAGDRVLVLDASASQSRASFEAEVALAARLLEALEPEQRFVVLACDSVCDAYPEDGLAAASPAMVSAAAAWLDRRAPRGSSDLAGAIEEGASRLAGSTSGQLIYVGDGVASAGEIASASIAARVRRAVPDAIDVRVIGSGRNVDEQALTALADALAATYTPLDISADLGGALDEVVFAMDQPIVRELAVELPSGVSLAVPPPASVRVGDELRLLAVTQGEVRGDVTLRGRVGGEPFEARMPVSALEGPRGFASRSFARGQIERLDAIGGDPAEIVRLSKEFFVMSRHTSMLVLENDAMFRDFGIERTRKKGRGAPSNVPKVRMGGALPDPIGATGNMWGNEIDDAFGAGGLGLSGIGEGGGGRGEPGLGAKGDLGLGSIGTIGSGSGNSLRSDSTGTGVGFGAGSGRLGGEHRSRPPSVRMGATSVSGRLPPEVIQRIVRQNFGRFRLCYERALREQPELTGRVTVKFVIGRDGNVASVAPASSTIDNKALVSCVVSSFRGLSFPQPEGGIVTVSYPIVFSPDGSSGSFSSLASPPTVTISTDDDAWMQAGQAAIDRLVLEHEQNPGRRAARAALVQGLLARGRFADAAKRAREYAAVDPDALEPLDLLAQALLANGDVDAALGTLDAMAEQNRTSRDLHVRIASAFEAAGDERRACAHWISAVDLGLESREAWRCRARVRGDRPEVLREIDAELAQARARNAATTALGALRDAVESGAVPAHAAAAAAHDSVAVRVTCTVEKQDCPTAVTINERGQVVSELLPDARGKRAASVSGGGTFRTVLVGGAPATKASVTITVGSRSRTTEASRGQKASVFATRVASPFG